MQATLPLYVFTLIAIAIGGGLSAWAVRYVKKTRKNENFGVFDSLAITGFTVNVMVVIWLIGYVILYGPSGPPAP